MRFYTLQYESNSDTLIFVLENMVRAFFDTVLFTGLHIKFYHDDYFCFEILATENDFFTLKRCMTDAYQNKDKLINGVFE
jgi:hypothetical protein